MLYRFINTVHRAKLEKYCTLKRYLLIATVIELKDNRRKFIDRIAHSSEVIKSYLSRQKEEVARKVVAAKKG